MAGSKAGAKAGRKGRSLSTRKAEDRHVRLAVRTRYQFNDPSKVPKVSPRSARAEQWERNNETPGVRHEVPLDESWDCKYGCEPFVWTQGQLHGWQCPYWNNEGGTRTPF